MSEDEGNKKQINKQVSVCVIINSRPVSATLKRLPARGGLGFNGQCDRFTVNVIRGRAGAGAWGDLH